jgi:hypothetical protein
MLVFSCALSKQKKSFNSAILQSNGKNILSSETVQHLCGKFHAYVWNRKYFPDNAQKIVFPHWTGINPSNKLTCSDDFKLYICIFNSVFWKVCKLFLSESCVNGFILKGR